MVADKDLEKKGESSPEESDLDWLDEADLWPDPRGAESKPEQMSTAEKVADGVAEGVRGISTFLAGMVDEYKDRLMSKSADEKAESKPDGSAKAISGKSTVEAESAKAAEPTDKEKEKEQDSSEAKEKAKSGEIFANALSSVARFVSNPMVAIARGLAPDPEVEKASNAFENLQVNNGVVEEVTTPQGTFRLAGTDKDGKDKYVHIKPGASDEGQEFKGTVAVKDGKVVVTDNNSGKSREYDPKPVKYDNLNVTKEGKVDTLDTPERSYRYIGPGSDGKDQYLVTTPHDQEGRMLNGSVTVKDGKVTINDRDSGVTHEYRDTAPPKDTAYDATRRLTVNATRALAGDGAAKQVDDAFKDPAKIQKWYNDASAKAAEAKNNADNAKAAEAKGPGNGDVPKGEAKGPGATESVKAEAKGPGEKTPTDKTSTTAPEKPAATTTVQNQLLPDGKFTTPDGKTQVIGADGKPTTVDGKPISADPLKTTTTATDAEKLGMPRVVENPAAAQLGDQLKPNAAAAALDGTKTVNPLDANKQVTAADASKTLTPTMGENSLLSPGLIASKDKSVTPNMVTDGALMRPSIDTSAIGKTMSDSKTATTSDSLKTHDQAKTDGIDSKTHGLDHKDSSPTMNLAFNSTDRANFPVKGGETKAPDAGQDKHTESRPFSNPSLIPSGSMERSSLLNTIAGGKSVEGKSLDAVSANNQSAKAQIEASNKPPADAVNKMLPMPNANAGGRDVVLPLNMSSNKSGDILPSAQSKTDGSSVVGKTDAGKPQLDPLTGKVQMNDSRVPGSLNNSSVLGGNSNPALNQNRGQEGGKNAGPTGIISGGVRDGVQQGNLPGGKTEQSGLSPVGGRPGSELPGQVRIDPVTGRVIRVDGVGTAIGVNGISGVRSDLSAGAISLTSATRRSQEGHYMIAEMTLAVVLAAGGIRRVLPTDRSSRDGGSGGSSEQRRQIERELSKLREPARADSLKFVASTFKLSAMQKDLLASGLKATMSAADLPSGRRLLLGPEGSRAFLMAVGQYREAKALTTQHAQVQDRPQQIALGFTQAAMVPLLADANGGRNFAMPVEPNSLENIFKAQQSALEEALRPLLNSQDFIEINDPFASMNVFASKGKRRHSRSGSTETLERRLAGGGADGDDDDEQDEEQKNMVLMRPTWLISTGETLVTIAEEQYSDPYIAWLIADLNKGNCQEHWMDGKRIVEFQSRQKITLPVWQDIVEFYASMPAIAKPERLVTIVAATEIDREVVDSVLGPIVANKSTFSAHIHDS